MPATMDRPRIQRATQVAVTAQDLPAGVVGQVEGVALVYDVVDSYNTTFARGCLDRTIRERVAAGKVKLYFDHGDSALTGAYDTHLHIGTVKRVWDAQQPDGTWAAMFSADLFDTEPGREAHEYLRAVAATGSETGVSIGMMTLPESTRAVINGQECERFREVPLREISITGESAVPGTKVTHVRQAQTLTAAVLLPLLDDDTVRAKVRAILGDATERTDSDAASGSPAPVDSDAASGDSQREGDPAPVPDPVPVTDRLAWCRANLKRMYDNGTGTQQEPRGE